MHLSPNIQHGDDWAVTASNALSPSSPPLTPELSFSSSSSSSSYETSNSRHITRSDYFADNEHTQYAATGDATSAGHTPRGSWLPQLDYRIMVSLNGSPCQINTDHGNMSRPGSVTPKNIPRFDDLTLADIEALEELPGASGRRQSASYRFGSNSVIKVSPHHNIFYEARMLAYIRQAFRNIPVPRVFGVRQLSDAAGRDRFCMLMEYIDGIGADEAVCEWSAEETRAFMDSVQTLRRTLASTTGCCIQAVDVREGAGGDKNADSDCEMSDDSDDSKESTVSTNSEYDISVQDELFDHIWQAMERGPFATEANFVSSVSVALRRRGAGAARLDLVSRMIDQLLKTSTEGSFPLQHANLTLGNFLVRRAPQSSGGGTPEIVGVLGWGQSGFYPAWWELAKMAASEDRLLVDVAALDDAFPRYSQHASVMLHVRDIIY